MKPHHNTIILAAGKSLFSSINGPTIDKWDFEVLGERLLEKVVCTYLSGNTFLAHSENITKSTTHRPEVKNVVIGNTQGALITALLAIRDCDLTLPLFIAPGDALIPRSAFEEFCSQSMESEKEISLVVFDSQNTNYSYVRTIDENLVEVCEKKVISSKATAGIFYFKSSKLFIECAEWAIMNNVKTNELFFLAPALNYAVVKGLNPFLFQINEEDYFRFSTHNEAILSEKRYKDVSQ